MKLIYAIMNQNNYVVELNNQGISFLISETEVDTQYGVESPESDNQYIYDCCGIRVYRKYIYFTDDYCVAVFEPVGNIQLKDGYAWTEQLPKDNSISETLLLAQNGNQSKTAPWVREHGIAHYLSWAETVLASKGYFICGAIEQIKNTYVSSVFIIHTDAGAMYLKITSSVYVNTAAIEQQITGDMGGIPIFLAVSPDGYAAITKEMSGEDSQNCDVNRYKFWMKTWGEKQVQIAGQNTYGLVDRSPQKLLLEIDEFEKRVNEIFTVTNRVLSIRNQDLLHMKLTEVKNALEQCCLYALPNTLCHADIRPGNVRSIDDSEVLYDWGMAFYGHPFYDLIHFLHVVKRQITENQKREIVDVYLAKWTQYGDKADLQKTCANVEKMKDYFMLAEDCRWVTEILKVCGGLPPKGTIDSWLLYKRLYYVERVFYRLVTE